MKSHGMIPFLDLVTPHLELEDELVAVFYSCIRNAHFIGGTMLEEFERDFAKFCEAKYCVGVANGTDAVRFALMGAGVQSGDLVITVPNTFIATTRGDFAGRRAAGVRRHRRKNLQPRSGKAAAVSRKGVPPRGFGKTDARANPSGR